MASAETPRAPPARAARWGGMCALLAVFGGLSGVIAATWVAPWFSWTGNALSDLGAPGRETELLFNGSVIGAGLLYLVFVWAMWSVRAAATVPGRVGVLMLGAGAVFLVGVGVFTEASPLHFGISVGYFFLYPPGVLIYGVAERRSHAGLLQISVGMALLALVFGLLQFTPVFTSQAIPEIVLSASLGVWSAVVGTWLRRGEIPRPAGPPPA